jgi:hypothetical protein
VAKATRKNSLGDERFVIPVRKTTNPQRRRHTPMLVDGCDSARDRCQVGQLVVLFIWRHCLGASRQLPVVSESGRHFDTIPLVPKRPSTQDVSVEHPERKAAGDPKRIVATTRRIAREDRQILRQLEAFDRGELPSS